MANRQYKQSDILKAIKAVPKWLLIQQVMDGKAVDEADPQEIGPVEFEVIDGRAIWSSKHTSIILRQLPGGDFNVGTGARSETIKSLSLAAMRFVVLVWDVGCRGIV